MIINSVKIKNYGIYYGENIYDFTISDPKKNIILIYGKNGSGKTTLLEAIKKAFYGCAFYGLKNPNKIYYENIKKRFNDTALSENQCESFIEINFQWKEENNIDTYTFRRIWNINNKSKDISVSEDLEILKNNLVLSKQDVENTENFFRTIFPQKIFDFFFFDGEDVKKLISTEYLEKELKEAIFTLFNIDIFKSMDLNLSSYIKNRNKNKTLSGDELELLNLENEKYLLEIDILSLNNQLHDLKFKEDNLKNEIKIKNQRFKNIGGDLYEKRSLIEREITELEYERNKETDFIKTLLLNNLSLFMNLDLLKKAYIQSKKEIDLKENHILLNQLETGLLGNLLIDSFENKINNNDIKKLIDNFKTKIDSSEATIHNLTSEELLKLKNKLNQLEGTKEEINSIINIRRENQSRLTSLKKQLNSINKNSEFEKLLEEIEKINNILHNLLENIIKIETNLLEKKNKMENVISNIKKLKDIVINGRKNQNKFNVVYKIQTILHTYIKKKNEEQIGIVKKIFIENFNSLHRKEGFIKDITINPETLEIKLFNSFGEIKTQLLSAGEKQVYILSLLGAFLKASGKEIPLIFDTLLGRLDEDHREKIITKYLPNVSNQVLILSTDSEITKENHKLLSQNIAKEYYLEYNFEKESVDLIIKGVK